MSVPREILWPIEPHTKAKHEILKKYLQRWFPILNKYNKILNYIDGFCGPGRYKGGEPGSPLIALNVALNQKLSGNIMFLFVDERSDRIEHLKTELKNLSIPSHFTVVAETGFFYQKLSDELDDIDKRQAEIPPTFAFIDPFGFSGVPFELIKRLLHKPRCEVLITFMVDSINRWINHPEQQITKNIAELFGTSKCFDIIQQSPKRIDDLRNLYQEQLRKEAKFVRYFEMLDCDSRVIYYLFFASNNRLGYVKMKEVMWDVDSRGEFRFSDATNPGQTFFFEEDHTDILWSILYKQFSGEEVLTDSTITFVEEETLYLKKHMNATLREHLNESLPPDKRITVRDKKVDGKKWKRGTFPEGVIVQFP